MQVIIPPVINEFLQENNFGNVELEELSVYTTALDAWSHADVSFVNSAVVIDDEDDVLLKWSYEFEESIFVVEVDGMPYEIAAKCALIEE